MVQIAEAQRPGWRQPCPDVADAEGGEEEGEGAVPRLVDRRHQVRRREGTEAFQADEVFHLEAVQVGGVAQEPLRDELGDALLAEAFYVHGAPGGEVGDALHPLRRAQSS